ncbi:MAG: ATP-binding protein [Deltaproteobacteria bacterium]|jgi:adenylate kinase family enzyme|nr:ATP-binding protein [Deltaproteobacteria bacterium]
MDKVPWVDPFSMIYPPEEIEKVLFQGAHWQIIDSRGSTRCLIITEELLEYWIEGSLVGKSDVHGISGKMPVPKEGSPDDVEWVERELFFMASPENVPLSPFQEGDLKWSPKIAKLVGRAFGRSRSAMPGANFRNAIYLGVSGCLLPLLEHRHEPKDDALELGTYLTGKRISTDDFHNLLPNLRDLSPVDVALIIKNAGLPLPSNLRAPRDGDRNEGETEAESELRRILKRVREKNRDEDFFSKNLNRQQKPASPKPVVREKYFSLPGRRDLERFFNDNVVEILNDPGKYEKLGIKFPSAIVLHGPPGSGKTFAVDKLVRFLKLPVHYINSTTIASPFIHDTPKKISASFDKAIKAAPSVLVIDEMESYLSSRGSSDHHQHLVEEVDEFLRRVPEAVAKKVLVIGMTNMIERIDAAAIRQGRFDHKIEVKLPKKEEVLELLETLVKDLPMADDVRLDAMAEALDGKPLSDTAFVLREAARITAKNDRESINRESLEEALKLLPKPDKGKIIGF